VQNNNLLGKNYRHVTEVIAKEFKLLLEEQEVIYQALLFKIKLFLKAVIINQDGTTTNEANSIIQALGYGNAIYCYVAFIVMGQ
jgi:hypothetical protein